MAYEEIQKLYVISFDDMSVDSRRCFDNSAEEMLGPYKSVLVAMIRGLCSPWKQPIYYSFDTQMTDQLLKTIVTSVEQTGLIVVAVVSDMGSKNAKVWKDLNVNYESPCFLNPIRINKRIWVLADVPHLLKLLRNHFLDDSLLLSPNIQITKKLIESILQIDCGEYKVAYKLTHLHVDCNGRDRQRVYLAGQLFSNTTAMMISTWFTEQIQASQFFQLVNDAFDILNSKKRFHSNVHLRMQLKRLSFGNFTKLVKLCNSESQNRCYLSKKVG